MLELEHNFSKLEHFLCEDETLSLLKKSKNIFHFHEKIFFNELCSKHTKCVLVLKQYCKIHNGESNFNLDTMSVNNSFTIFIINVNACADDLM